MDQLDGWRFAQVIASLLLGFALWVGKNYIRRFEVVEHEAVRQNAFDKTVEDIKGERRVMHIENKEILKRIEDKIDIAAQATLVEQVRGLAEKMADLESYAEDLKHEHVDPYIRAVEVLKSRVDGLERR